MLIDNFNRIISYVRISITDRCDLRCQYCTRAFKPSYAHDHILSYGEILRFIRVGASLGLSKVRLTGGEPLGRPGLCFLLGQIIAIDEIEDIGLTTNGVELEQKAEELRGAGLKRVNISLDSLKAERFRFITGVNAFDKVMTGIEKAMKVGFHPIKINTVIIRGFNDDEVLDFTDFAREQGLQVRFIEFMPFGDIWDSSKVLTSAEVSHIIQTKYSLTPDRGHNEGPAKVFSLPGGEGQVGFISPMSSHICCECNRIRLTPDGKLKPCLFSNQEYDVKMLLRNKGTDDDLAEFIRHAVFAKPKKKSDTDAVREAHQSMRSIGG